MSEPSICANCRFHESEPSGDPSWPHLHYCLSDKALQDRNMDFVTGKLWSITERSRSCHDINVRGDCRRFESIKSPEKIEQAANLPVGAQ